MTFGLLIFGAAGITAGYLGVPRRLFDVSYEGTAPAIWQTLMSAVGVGAVFMTVSLALYVFGLAATLLGRKGERDVEAVGLPAVSWGGATISGQAAWVGPISVVILIAGMYVFTALGFELMQSLPLVASGGGGH